MYAVAGFALDASTEEAFLLDLDLVTWDEFLILVSDQMDDHPLDAQARNFVICQVTHIAPPRLESLFAIEIQY
ncbi:MAG: hypothetical protein E5V79_06205 [Mesorhizobium sp.]|nr:MAG: hypothetical protein E5V79_06205 [Mesorhizobium sp.]